MSADWPRKGTDRCLRTVWYVQNIGSRRRADVRKTLSGLLSDEGLHRADGNDEGEALDAVIEAPFDFGPH